MNRFTISVDLPASPRAVYNAWLDGERHGEMTGSPATGSTKVGGEFTAHGGYITGINLELKDGERVLQTWRTSEFAESDPDSSIEVAFGPIPTGTRITLRHWNIPPGQAESYEAGWQDHYFTPMRDYFSRSVEQ